jgi:WD40 repeat protein
LEATAWSPDERQVYRCCHQYASTSSSPTSFSIETIDTLGRGLPSGRSWIQSAWLWDNRQVLVDYDFRYADNTEKSAVPLFDPAAQTWLDLQATLGLPEENICRWWALSPDRRTVAIDCYDSGWYLADLQSNRVLELDMPQGGSAEFSPDGRLLALHSWDGAELRIFAAGSGELLHTQAGARPLSWHPERPWLLVAAAGERSVAVLDLSDRQAPSLIAVPAPALHLHNLQPLALWAPQGGLLLVTELGELAWLPDIGSREPLVFTPPHDYVHAVKFSPDGRQVAFVAGRMDFGSREAIYVYPLPEE